MPVTPNTKTVPVAQLAYAIREVESGGIPADKRYSVVNSIGATGAYQVRKQYVAAWTKEALGKALTLTQWLGNVEAQDQVAIFRLGRDQKKYGSWESAAAVWFSGQPDPGSTSSDGGNTVREYVDKVGKALGLGKAIGTTAAAGGAESAGFTSGLMDAINGITRPFIDIAEGMLSVGKFAEFLLKLALPSTWVRIACGVLGAGFLMGGLVVLGLEATKKEMTGG